MTQPVAIIIDDQIANVQMYTDLLRIIHYEKIHTFTDSLQALNWMETNEAPQLIVLDVNMPRIDGYEIYKYIRHHNRYDDACVVISTANRHMAELISQQSVPSDHVFLKPYNLCDLQTVARSIQIQ